MLQRAQTALLLFFLFMLAAVLGDVWYWGLVLLVLNLGGWEWARMFGQRGFTGSLGGVLGLIWVMMIDVQWHQLGLLRPGVAVVLIIAMVQMVIRTGKGYPEPATSFSVKLAGGLYLGWMGMHLVMLRMLPDGLYWTLLTLPTVFAADTTAYLMGRRVGRRKLAPRISPKKTWEGYLFGIVGAVLIGAAAGLIWYALLDGTVGHMVHGALIGLLCGSLCLFGDLGISALKRDMGVKDSSGLLPGHGGFLDRLDTVLLAGVLGYYYVMWFAAI